MNYNYLKFLLGQLEELTSKGLDLPYRPEVIVCISSVGARVNLTNGQISAQGFDPAVTRQVIDLLTTLLDDQGVSR